MNHGSNNEKLRVQSLKNISVQQNVCAQLCRTSPLLLLIVAYLYQGLLLSKDICAVSGITIIVCLLTHAKYIINSIDISKNNFDRCHNVLQIFIKESGIAFSTVSVVVIDKSNHTVCH